MHPPLPAVSCRTASVVALLAVGCAGPEEDVRPASVAPLPPAASQVLNFGYDQAVALGAGFVSSRGHQMQLAMAKMDQGMWWLSYTAGAGQPGLDLRVDALTGRVEVVPPPAPQTTPQPVPAP
jgi:hypothetical protein